MSDASGATDDRAVAPAELAARIAERAGDDAVRAVAGPGGRGEPSAFAIDGRTPSVVAAPADADAVAATLRAAAELGAALIVRGGGTAMGVGNRPERLDLVLATDRLTGVVYHEPADLVVSLAAGTPLTDAARALEPAGQLLPLDPPGADHGASVGGAVASGLAGPRRLLLGGPRERILGVAAVTAAGVATRAGGRVTKNVAGFDLPRLYAGSLGGLAVITEASFKVLPRPVRRALIVATSADVGRLDRLRRGVLDAGLPLAALEVVSPAAWVSLGDALGPPPGDGWALGMLVEGPPSRVRRVIEEVGRLAGASGVEIEAVEEDGDAAPSPIGVAVGALRDLPLRASPGGGRAWLRLSVGPAAALEAAREALAAGDRVGVGPLAVGGRAGDGVLDLVPTKEATPEAVLALFDAALAIAGRRRGSAAILDAEPAVKERVADVFGPPGPAVALLRRVKAAFDPDRRLAPGRSWGRI